MSKTFFFIQTACLMTVIHSMTAHTFFYNPTQPKVPQLVLITGCTGTGKSTFGMSVALSQGILRCLSTDSIRQTLRTAKIENPALYRSSYSGSGDAIFQWRETCTALEVAIEGVVMDALNRGNSLVLEGVGVVPSSEMINMWVAKGGVAMGCVMNIKSADEHRELIFRRGEMTGKVEEAKLKEFARIRLVQEEMVRLGELNNWLIVEQRVAPAPIEIIGKTLRESMRGLHKTL